MWKVTGSSKFTRLLIYTVKGISDIVVKGSMKAQDLGDINEVVLDSLFKTITNANFDEEAIKRQIRKNIEIRDALAKKLLPTYTMQPHYSNNRC